MIKLGKVEKYLRKKASKEILHFTLIDPDKTLPKEAAEIAKKAFDAGTDAIFVGGSIGISEQDVDSIVKAVKKAVKIPVILFPGNVTGISKYADAILFMSLLNSDDPYFIVGAQVLGSVIVKRYGIEPLPTAYIILGEGGAAGVIGKARPLPVNKPELAVAYALAASMMGMRFVYFERGSGAPEPVPPEVIVYAKKVLPKHMFIIVGGGIRTVEDAERVAKAKPNAIVTGTIVEKDPEKALEIIRAIKGVTH